MFVCINRLKCQRAQDDVGEREKPEKTAEEKEKNRIKSEQVNTRSRRLKVWINAVNKQRHRKFSTKNIFQLGVIGRISISENWSFSLFNSLCHKCPLITCYTTQYSSIVSVIQMEGKKQYKFQMWRILYPVIRHAPYWSCPLTIHTELLTLNYIFISL